MARRRSGRNQKELNVNKWTNKQTRSWDFAGAKFSRTLLMDSPSSFIANFSSVTLEPSGYSLKSSRYQDVTSRSGDVVGNTPLPVTEGLDDGTAVPLYFHPRFPFLHPTSSVRDSHGGGPLARLLGSDTPVKEQYISHDTPEGVSVLSLWQHPHTSSRKVDIQGHQEPVTKPMIQASSDPSDQHIRTLSHCLKVRPRIHQEPATNADHPTRRVAIPQINIFKRFRVVSRYSPAST